tara:strand:+ start:1912 stop:2631 length:720 start_codon:yes stop_codon:yes gene_type:complete
MAKMAEDKLLAHEWVNTNTSPTHNQFFDDNGYCILKNICNPNVLYHPIPEERGLLQYYGKGLDVYEHLEVEDQVVGSIARFNHPQYRRVHKMLRPLIEEVIGRKLYETYFYDRFYFPGQELFKHTDRPAAEISISIHVSTNITHEWPIWIKTPDVYVDDEKSEIKEHGRNVPVTLNAGDGLLYKGCERPHWRDRMPGTIETEMAKHFNREVPQLYYHQIFFHYVLQDGIRAHFAWDAYR